MQTRHRNLIPFKEWCIFLGIFAGAILICTIFREADGIEGYASPVFVLAVLLISRFTSGYLYGLTASVLGVVCVNYLFTYPYMAVNFSISGYPLTFFTLLVVSLITSTLTTQAKQRDHLLLENEKEKYRSNLLRSISHDIRTPLTSIIGATAALLRTEDLSQEEQRALLTDINKEASWLLGMVENLLSITKIDGVQNIVKEEWPIEEILGESVQKIRKAYPEAPLYLTIPQMPLFVPMDPILIEQVLFNLIENSLLHSEHLTQIQISVTIEKEACLFRIEDDGGGFPPETLSCIKRNRTLSGQSVPGDKKRNLGIGLSVCRAIIQAHNGTISFENTRKGALAAFTLPMNHAKGD
ncbi:MAG: DUF4118 domain-containing protein [Lachnospiraceae bacterium]|nr:DUF4118 domain-containing protein [Lachnospiraceae bacterium]